MAFIRLVDRLNKGLEVLVGVVLAIMTLVVFLQVIVRFLLTALGIQTSVPWTEELARYLMIWLIFIGGAVAARKADSLAVEALVQAVPRFFGKLIKIGSHLISLFFYAVIFVIGLEWAKFGFTETAPVMKVSMSYLYASMCVGAALTILSTVTILVDVCLNKKDLLDVADEEIEEVLAEFRNGEKEVPL